MSENHPYSPAALCALVNSGKIRIPLSHSRALEIVARLEGAVDWNHACLRPDAGLLKTRAAVLRSAINARLVASEISPEAAKACIDLALAVQTAASKARPTETKVNAMPASFQWPRVGETRDLVIADIAFVCHHDLIEHRTARFIRIGGPVIIAVPPAAEPTKKSVRAWMADIEITFPKLVGFGGLIPLSGDPSALDNYAPLDIPSAPRERSALATRLFHDYARYCGTVASDLEATLTFLAAAIENLPASLGKYAMTEFLNEMNSEHFGSRDFARSLNFGINPGNRAVAGRLFRLAEKLGCAQQATKLAEYEKEPENVRMLRQHVERRQDERT